MLLSYHPVKFAENPPFYVSVGAATFKKIWELGNRVVYIQVKPFDISSQVLIYG